ncbi:hypothetical protein, partial [Delftia sp. 67-8]|uniref:hypothetical protein n=2 Tax=Comamonadaceae TaxID=80864 RepID=UPI00257EBD0C
VHQMNRQDILRDFGKIFIKEARDSSIERVFDFIQGNLRTPESIRFSEFYSPLSQDQKDDFKYLALLAIDSAIFRILRMADQEVIDIKFNDSDSISQMSDGLAGELFGDSGWMKEFSDYPSTTI